jgi:hypothetical protein
MRPSPTRATVCSSQGFAHDGLPFTLLYEHISDVTSPCSTQAWRGAK